MNTIGLLTVNITDVLHFIRETEMFFARAQPDEPENSPKTFTVSAFDLHEGKAS